MKRSSQVLITALISILFSACILIGQSYDSMGNWELILGSSRRVVISGIKFGGMAFIAFGALNFLYGRLEKYKLREKTDYKINEIIFEHHPVFCPWIIIAIAWLPNYIIYFPGCMTADAMKQLEQFLTGQFTNHHPIFTTLIEGFFVSIGRKAGNMELGIALYLGIMLMAISLIFAQGFHWMYKHNVSYKIRWIGLTFFCIFPIWSAYARTLVKDILYYPVFYIFVLMIFDAVIEEDIFFRDKRKAAKLLLVSIILCLMRHNGIYVTLGTFLGMTVFCKKYRRQCFMFFVIMFLFWKCYGSVISICGVEPGGKQEMLSIPFQQTARYLKYHGKEVTQEEQQVINNVLDYRNIAKNYNPNLSDPVKDTYKKKDKYLSDYFKVWWKQLKKHPGTYIQATLNGTYGYYSYKEEVKNPYGYYKQPVCFIPYQKKYSIRFNDSFRKQRVIFEKVLHKTFNIKILRILLQPAFYNWIYIVLLGFFVQSRRMRKYWIVFIPFIVSFLLCIASPVNGDTRYMLPLSCTWILYLAFISNRLEEEQLEIVKRKEKIGV